LVTGSEAVIEYIKNQLMASAVAYFEATLKVPRLTSPLIVDGACGTLNPPDMLLTTGVEADLVILVTSEYNTDADYVAYSIPCSLDWDTNRPTYGMLSINLATLETAQLVQLSDNLYTVLHEMTHLLGFSQNLYQYYIDPSTNELLDNVIGTTTANGQTINYINVEPLTTRVREHFGCDTAPGGYLENNGGSGSAGSHWERRVFYNEYMTANDILDSRVSEFTLALLEGTGWYQVNYNNSEPLQWGQSGGCSFLDGACMNDKTFEPNFNEFCSPLTAEGCSYTGRAVAVCGSGTQISTDSSLPSSENYWGNDTVVVDSFSDNCPYYIGLPNADCENPADAAFAYLQQEFYGQGSRCFAGTLSPAGFYFAQTVAFCFPVKCNTADDGSNIVTVTIGDTVVNCTEEKTVSVSGMTGVLQCPDPDTFCTISNPEYCRVGCSGHGTCVDNICQCPEGWTGPDCSAREYVDSCTRCANETENTSCFGDLCACNPNATNSTCPVIIENKGQF